VFLCLGLYKFSSVQFYIILFISLLLHCIYFFIPAYPEFLGEGILRDAVFLNDWDYKYIDSLGVTFNQSSDMRMSESLSVKERR
jgi:hypothetical protein